MKFYFIVLVFRSYRLDKEKVVTLNLLCSSSIKKLCEPKTINRELCHPVVLVLYFQTVLCEVTKKLCSFSS